MITQIDPVLCEDGSTVMFYGYEGGREDVVNIGCMSLPQPIDAADFQPEDWCNVVALRWTRWVRDSKCMDERETL